MHWCDCMSARVLIAYLLYCMQHYTALSCPCVHSASIHEAASTVHFRPCGTFLNSDRRCSCSTGAWHSYCTCTVACASTASMQSCVSHCANAAGASRTSVPTLKGMDTLAVYSANTLRRAGKQGRSPPLSIAQGRSSPHSLTMGIAIIAWLHKPGRGPTGSSWKTLSLWHWQSESFMKTIEK